MTAQKAALGRNNGKWQVYARKGAEGALEGSWVCLGGCRSQAVAIRVFLAVLGTDKR